MKDMDTELNLTIDGKKNRLRIAKPTMRMIGEPSMVQLLYNPAERIILVRAAKEPMPGGQELSIHLSKPGGDYEIYSSSFVRKIRAANPEMREMCSYRFHGETVDKENLVLFPISTLEKIDHAWG